MLEPLLKACWQIEEIAAEIYRILASGPYAEPLRRSFATLARDEREHAAQLEQALRLRIDQPMAQKRIAWERVEEALDLAGQLRGRLTAAPRDVEEALQLAIQLEKNFVKVHLENAVFFEDERVAGLFRGLARGDEEHLQTLTDCLQWWRQHKPRPAG